MTATTSDSIERTFVIWNAFGGHNLGDEAILWAISRQIYRLYPNAKLYVLVSKPGLFKQAEAVYKDWRVEPVYGFWNVYFNILRKARLVVGGGHLVDNVSRGLGTVITSSFVLTNWLFGNRPLILFVGAERVKRLIPATLVKYIYSRASAVVCRDPRSTEALRDSGVTASKLVSAKDVVFSLDRKLLPQWKMTAGAVHPRVAVVIAYDRRRMSEPDTSVVDLVRSLVAAGWSVELIAHDIRDDYDMGALRSVKAQVGDHDNLIAHKAGTAQDAFEIYSRVDAVISGRMHPLIMAALSGTLPIAFGGRIKVKSLTEMSGIPVLAEDDPAREVDRIRELLAQRAQLSATISQSIDKFRGEVEAAIENALETQVEIEPATA